MSAGSKLSSTNIRQPLSNELSIDARITFVAAFNLELDSTRHAEARVINIDGTRDKLA
jgi:hypothetical protein